MRILREIPFELDVEKLMRTVHVEAGSEDASELERLASKAMEAARPKAIYRECYVGDKGEDRVEIGGVSFSSRALRKNLDKVERVFAYVATCGHELDGIDTGTDDFLAPFWLDAIKVEALRTSIAHLREHLDGRYALGKTASMNPGSGDASVWPIEQQKELFSLLGDVKSAIGVELTPSFLMMPNKTVSGIIFPTEVEYRACKLCRRENCPSRGAEFDEVLWQSMGHE